MGYNYLYREENTGETFFVQTDTKAEADEIADQTAWEFDLGDEELPDLTCLGCYSDEEAEWMGYDTY